MRKTAVKDLCDIAAMAAVLEVSKHILDALPNIELVTVLLMVYTLHFGVRKSIICAYIFAFIEFLIYGISIWTITYLYVWEVLIFATYMLRKMTSSFGFSLAGGIFGLSFGALCALTTLVTAGWNAAVSWWIAGIPYDLIHGVSNFLTVLLLEKPLCNALNHLDQ